MDEILDLLDNPNIVKEEGSTFAKDSDPTKTDSNKKKKYNPFKDEIPPKAIDASKVKASKAFTFLMNDNNISNEDSERIIKLIRVLKDKGFKFRLYCNKAGKLGKKILEIFDKDKVVVISPWKKFCPLTKYKTWTPSNENYEATAYYIKNFTKLPPSVKSIATAYMTLVLGPYNNSAIEYVLIYDPYSTDDKIDWKKSNTTSNVIVLSKKLKDINLQVYNLAIENDLKDFINLIK